MTPQAQSILEHLEAVAEERMRRASQPALEASTAAVKAYQQTRFAMTYAEFLASARYGPAARFFLDELYSPKDFTERDAQFARVVPALVRLFPDELVAAVEDLALLHALTERLDTRMAAAMVTLPITGERYIAAWRVTGERLERERQINLTLSIGKAIDRLTGKPFLRQTLHLMRGPARAAGLGALQSFLESGFDTFKAMRGAGEFLATVGDRERVLASRLFDEKSLEVVVAELP